MEISIFLKGKTNPIPGHMDAEGTVRSSDELHGYARTPQFHEIDHIEDKNGNPIKRWR